MVAAWFRWVLALLCLLHGANAAVYSPRVLSPHVADTCSMKTFAAFHRWRDLSGDAKALAIFEYLTDPRTGIYPLGVPAWEGEEELSEHGAVRDPVKMLNVYSIGHCGTLGPTMAAIMEQMGVGPARTLIIPGWNHVASEVFYGGRWHYLDLDVRAIFPREDGSLASMAEAQREDALWKRPNGPRFFPLDALDQVRQTYAKTAVQHRYGVGTGGHTMDYVLRAGETFTRWWKPQGGRWNHHRSYGERPFPRSVLERAPRGPKCKHPSFTIHTHGNGRFVYTPNLTARSTDFADGVYDSRNVEPGPNGLTLKEPGEGYAIFEVRSPYVIVPLVNELDDEADDREASVVKVDGAGITLALSLDHGFTWRKIGDSAGTFDLTPHVRGTYGYLLKLTLRDRPTPPLVRSLQITTWVQVHPASLPALGLGTNTMRLATGDHHGLPTRVLEIRPSAARRDEFLKYLVEPPKDYDPARRTSRIRGEFVVKVQAPPRTTIAWFSAGASFQTHQGDAAKNTRNAISYALDQPKAFQEIYRAEMPPDQSHWHYNVDREVKLERPAAAVFVRYAADPGLNNIRLYAHCLDNPPRATASPVVITHHWTENGIPKTKRLTLNAPGEYQVVTAAEPANESVEIAVANTAHTN